MSQSEWLGAMLIAGFLVWLAMNKRLAAYWSILTGGAGVPTPATSSAPTPGNVPATAGAGNPAAPMGPRLFPLFEGIFPLNVWPFNLGNPPANPANNPAGSGQPTGNAPAATDPNASTG